MACLSPITIDNPNYGYLSLFKGRKNIPSGSKSIRVYQEKISDRLKPLTSKMLVPCGWCANCLRKKQIYLVQRSQGEVLAGNDLYFFTLTYQNKYIPTIDIGDKRYYYCDHSDFRNMFNRIRVNKLLPFSFKYMIVSEYGGKRGRPHLHGILSVPALHQRETRAEKIARGMLIHDVLLKEWRRNVAYTESKTGKLVPNTRCPDWRPLCRYIVSPDGHRTFDCHYVDPSGSAHGEMDVAFYVTKYCLKPNERIRKTQSYLKLNFSPDEYRKYWQLISPHVWFSKEYGSPYHPAVKNHVLKGAQAAVSDGSPFPFWFSSDANKTFPLALYYTERTLPRLYKEKVFDHKFDWKCDNQDPNYEDYLKTINRFDKVRNSIDHRDIIDFFPEQD